MTIKVISRFVALSLVLFYSQANALVVLDQGASVTFSVDHSSNPTMSQDEHPIWLYTFLPGYRITLAQGKNQFFFNGNVSVERSSDESVSGDREDPLARIGWAREYEKGTVGLVASYVKASTRVTELTETGNLTSDGSSIGRSIAATWSHLITEKLKMSLEGGYRRQDFSGETLSSDYTVKSLNSEFLYELNENISPFIRASVNEFDPLDIETDAINYQNFLPGANFIISPKLSFSIGAGFSHIETVGNRWIGLSSFAYQGEKYRLDGSVERSVAPSSTGILQESDNLLLGYSYDLSDVSRWGTDLNLRKNRTGTNSETKQLAAWYSRDLSALWQMRLSMRLRNIKSDTLESTDGNVIGISFKYDTPSF